jgi:hypothetical protein
VTLTATFVYVEAQIIYWDSSSSKMQVGKWTTQGGPVNIGNQLFFQFGSVVGFTNTMAVNGTAWPGASAVKFNPVTGSPSYDIYTTIPNWNGSTTTDGYISSSSYHTLANVKAGRGDPCKLVGLTVAQIQAGTYDSGLYRLPTQAENEAYLNPTFVAGSNGWTAGVAPTAGIHTSAGIATTFLPASGYRYAIDGANHGVGGLGVYWSSRPGSATEGYRLYFVEDNVFSASNYYAREGYPIRCVKK